MINPQHACVRVTVVCQFFVIIVIVLHVSQKKKVSETWPIKLVLNMGTAAQGVNK